MKIIKATDPVQINGVKVLLYGEAGKGKTSLAFTTRNPILIDFDKGLGRALNHVRSDAFEPRNWEDFTDAINSAEIDSYDTIIIDTAGGMYQYAMDSLKKTTLSIKDYGVINSKIYPALAKLQLKGKNIVFIAHPKQETEGEKRFIPNIGGAVTGKILASCDLVGYVGYDGDAGKLYVNFGNSAFHLGKDCGQIGKVYLPDYVSEPLFLQTIIDKTKAQMQGTGAVYGLLSAFQELCENATTAGELNEAVTIFQSYGLQSEAQKNPFREFISKAAIRLNLTFDKEKKAYVTN